MIEIHVMQDREMEQTRIIQSMGQQIQSMGEEILQLQHEVAALTIAPRSAPAVEEQIATVQTAIEKNPRNPQSHTKSSLLS